VEAALVALDLTRQLLETTTMRTTLGKIPDAPPAPVSADPALRAPATLLKEIPYDHVARFALTGKAGNRVQDVVNISVDGAFVAATIGYSFIPSADRVSGGVVNRNIDFKYSIIDSGSGRELQNRPIHNIAGLGEPGGSRPFRAFAKPMLFMPRSTIRFEIEEVTDETPGELFIVLHGYKILGYGGSGP
jgi:hypothetical protein